MLDRLVVVGGENQALAGRAIVRPEPLAEERYDLLMRRRDYFEPPMQSLLAFARSPAFAERAAQMGGYDLAGNGSVRFNGP